MAALTIERTCPIIVDKLDAHPSLHCHRTVQLACAIYVEACCHESVRQLVVRAHVFRHRHRFEQERNAIHILESPWQMARLGHLNVRTTTSVCVQHRLYVSPCSLSRMHSYG